MTDLAQTAKLRILFLSSTPRWDDHTRWLVTAAVGLSERGHDVLLAAPHGARLLDRAREAGIAHRSVRMRHDLDPRAMLAVRRILHEQRPHAVFVTHDSELRSVSLATVGETPPLVFLRTAAMNPGKAGWIQRWANARCVTRILTDDNPMNRSALESAPRNQQRILRDGVPIGARDGAPDRTALRRELRLPRRKRLVVHVGELSSDQGQETTLATLVLMRQHGTSDDVPTVVFVGTGPAEPELRDRCYRLGVQEHVLWLGFRSHTAPYLAAADVCVLPAAVAGTRWTVLEAWAQGTPVVAANTDAVTGWIDDGIHGLLVPPNNADALATTLRHLLEDENLAQRLVHSGLRHVAAHWSAEAMLDDLECLILAELVRRRTVADRNASAARIATRAALFVDRDGTLVRNVPYNGDPAAVELAPDAARALRWVRDAAIPVIVITNQSGIAQGFHTEADVVAVHAHIRDLLRPHGADIDALYYCPHHPDHGAACDCRKPKPGLLLRAIDEHDLVADEGLMVGDAQRDLDAARAAGVPAAGLAVFGGDHDFEVSEAVYPRWTAVVRDFLRARWLRIRFDSRPASTTGAPETRLRKPSIDPTVRSE